MKRSLSAQLARNSLWILIARIGAQVSMVIVTYLLARRLGAAGFGEYAFLAATLVIGNTLTTFGSDMYLIREIAAASAFSKLPAALLMQLALSCLFIVLVYWFAPWMPNQTPESIAALQVYSFALLPLAFFTVFTSALRGQQEMSAYAGLNLATSLLQVIAVAVLIQRGVGVVVLAYVLLVIQCVAAILGGVFCAPFLLEHWKMWRFSFQAAVDLFRACLPIALIAGLGIVYQKLSISMLSFLGGASMVGWFSAAVRTLEAARTGHFAALTAIYPVMSESGGNREGMKTVRASWLVLFGLAGVESIFLFLFATDIVQVFFGGEYLPSIPVLKIVLFTLIPYTVNSFLSLAFLAARQEKVIAWILLASTLILLFLNVWWIPRGGLIGAGWAILTAETIQSVLFLLAWRIRFPWKTGNGILQNGISHELPDLPR